MSLSLSSGFEVLFCSKKGRREAIKREKLLGRINGDDLMLLFMNFRCAPREVSIRPSRAEQRGFFLNVDYEKLGV